MIKPNIGYKVWDIRHTYSHRQICNSLEEAVQLAKDWLRSMEESKLRLPTLMIVKTETTIEQKGRWMGETSCSRPVRYVYKSDDGYVVKEVTP